MTIRGFFAIGAAVLADPAALYSPIPQTPEDERLGIYRYRRSTDGETLVLETMALPTLPENSHPTLHALRLVVEGYDADIIRTLIRRRTTLAELRDGLLAPDSLPPAHAERCAYRGAGVWECVAGCRMPR